jgi:TonB-dependent starch-binding outer membrane protein SusC
MAFAAAVVMPAKGWGQGGSGGPGGGGVIVGQVSDKDLQQPVADASIVVVGTGATARTADDGHFRITGVPAGRFEVRAMRLGYATLAVRATVVEGQQSTANFSLTRVAASLNQIVTTATQETESKRANGAAIQVVQADSIPQAPITDFSDMLTSRAAGVVVEHSSGETGTGSTIRIRGASSLYLSNEPIYIIDGVRLDNSPYSTNLSLGGQGTSRVDEIPEQDIETFEILKGPTASALYGTEAANGIVSITTKHGEEGATKWDMYAEGGNVQNATHWPPNWGTLTQDYSPNVSGYPEATNCSLNDQALQVDAGPGNGGCSPDSTAANGGLVTYSPLAQHSPYRIGQRADVGVDAHGGSATSTFYIGATKTSETGILVNNSVNKATIRTNANFQVTPQLGIALTGGYLTNNIQLPQNDNGYYGPLSNGYLGYAVGTSTDASGHPSYGYNPIPPSQSEAIFDGQSLDHYTIGGTLTWHPLSWLNVTGVTGLDQDWQNETEQEPQNEVFVTPLDSIGHRYVFNEVTQSQTDNVSITATSHPFSDVTSKSTIGMQYYYFYQHLLTGQANNPVPGTTSLNGATAQPYTDENTIEQKQFSVLGSEQFAWRDRRFLQIALRGDNNSSFGAKVGTEFYPAANASWVVSDEDFWPRNPALSTFRPHVAFGISGLSPQGLAGTTIYQPGSTKFNGNEAASVSLDSIGAGVKPERSQEIEGGIEFGFAKDRVTLDATTYYKYTSQTLVQVPLAPSLGGPTQQLVNLGSVQNLGIEIEVHADVVQSDPFTFNLDFQFSGNQNRLLSLGPGDSLPVVLASGNQEFHRGYPLAGYWTIPLSSTPPQPSNGLTGLENVGNAYNGSLPVADWTYRGSSIPVRDAAITPTFIIAKQVRVSANFEYRGGYTQFDASEQFRCTFGTCRGNNDPTDSWSDKVCAAAAVETSGAYEDCWLEKADFIKWRELSVSYDFPKRWLQFIHFDHMSVTVAGRNLLTLWTLWKGVDPEVDSDGQDNFNRYQFAVQPLARYFFIRFNATY